MNLNLNGKVAVITGSSKGIGAGIAKSLAAEGVSVVINYVSSKEAADMVVDEISAAGGSAISLQGDVGNSADVKRMFELVNKAFGKVDIVVNNAGIYKIQPIENVTAESFQREVATNVLGPILTTQEALKYFPDTGGSIINISSGASVNPAPNRVLYAATKGAVDSITKALSKELAPRKIRVNTVAPGATLTEGAIEMGFVGSELEKTIISRTPLGRIGKVEEVAAVVVFLVSDAAGWVTGERISASGGL